MDAPTAARWWSRTEDQDNRVSLHYFRPPVRPPVPPVTVPPVAAGCRWGLPPGAAGGRR
jgi:hypothetical protein